jgi:DNA-binding response OmpR family regulator
VILFIDDEPRYIKNFVEDLELTLVGHGDIRVVDRVDEALSLIARLNERGSLPELIILDIMMAPYNSFTTEETNGGIRTGLALFDKIKHVCPILIFTNVGDASVKKTFEDQGCLYVKKPDVLPHEFSALVRNILKEHRGGKK